jgi:signal transduction histidine kinase
MSQIAHSLPEVSPGPADQRVLLVAPTRRDGEITRELLRRADVACDICADARALHLQMQAGVGAVLLAEHVLLDPHIGQVLSALQLQPAWSDVPVVLLTRGRDPSPTGSSVIGQLNNLTVLDRPASMRSVRSAVLAALRARRRQYQMRDELNARHRAEAALRQADQRKDRFLATLAHELRNPLAPLTTGLQVLGRLPADSPQATRIREMMGRQLVQLVRLIDDLLDVSRIATGKVVLQVAQLDLRSVLTAALEACQPAIDDAQHTVRLDLPKVPVWVAGDATRLVQVVSNLLTNACKYTPPGGLIEVKLTEQAGEAEVRVSDNGAGIPPHLLDKVFDIFAQVHRTLDSAQGGLGIGLSLVRRLMHLHGGSIVAESAGLDQGSTFIVRLPAVARGPAAGPDALLPAPSDGQRQRPRRVLVVDDNRDAADSLAMLLRIGGHYVRTEYAGADALRVAADFQPEVVFCDLGMPGMDGHDVARSLRAQAQNDSVVLVALTGWGSEDDRLRTQQAGFDFHLVKPVVVDMLEQILTDR